MNTACLFGALIIVLGEAGGLHWATALEGKSEQRILLRKLQNFQRNDIANAETVTWNEILADVLVKNFNIFSKEDELHKNVKKPKNLATKCVSDVLVIYKSIYDRFKLSDSNQKDQPTNTNQTTEKNPKEDVEIVETVLKNVNCDDCDEIEAKESVDRDLKCPDGYEINKDGECEALATSKLVMAVPRQCPIGYRADRLGYCRIMF